MWLLDGKLRAQSPMAIRIGAMVVGCVIIALGKAVVIMTDAGSGPNDLFSLIVSDAINKRKKIEFRWIRIVTDIMFTVVGFLLGGVMGIGTLVTAFLTGPIVQVFLAPCRKLTNAVLAKVEGKTVDEMLSQDRAEREARA